MDHRQRFASALDRRLEHPPVACVTTIATDDMMAFANVRSGEAHTEARAMAMVAHSAYPLYGIPSVRIPFCFTVEAEAMGFNVAYTAIGPEVIPDPSRLRPEFDPVHRRVRALVEAARSLKGDLPLILGASSPFTLLCSCWGLEHTLMDALLSPGTVGRALKAFAREEGAFVGTILEVADHVSITESLASPDLLPADMLDLVIPGIASVVDGVDILHVCGNVLPVLPRLDGLGIKGLSIEGCVDPREARRALDVAIIGNVGTVRPLLQGTVREVRRATQEAIEGGVDIVSPGCGVAAGTPAENLREMVRTVGSLPRCP